MIRLLRAEVLKVRSLWSTWVLVGSSLVVAAAFGALIGFAPHNRRDLSAIAFPAHGTPRWFDDLFSAMSSAETLAMVIGILAVTTEYRHRTVTSTYLAEPRRGRVVGSKLVTSAGWGGVAASAAGIGCLVLGLAVVIAGNGTSGIMLTEFGHVFPGVFLASMMFAVYGVGLGALLRNQVVALVVGLGFASIVEPIVVAVVPGVGKYLPGQAAQALSSVTANAGAGFGGRVVHLLPWWAGGIMLLAYGVVLAVAGTYTSLRADVT